MESEKQVIKQGPVSHQTGHLESSAHAHGCYPVGASASDGLSTQKNFTAGNREKTANEIEQSGLPCAVRSDNGGKLACLGLQADLEQGLHAAEILAYLIDIE